MRSKLSVVDTFINKEELEASIKTQNICSIAPEKS